VGRNWGDGNGNFIQIPASVFNEKGVFHNVRQTFELPNGGVMSCEPPPKKSEPLPPRMEAGSPRATSPSASFDSSPSGSLLRSSKRQRVSLGGSRSISHASVVTTILGATDTFDGRHTLCLSVYLSVFFFLFFFLSLTRSLSITHTRTHSSVITKNTRREEPHL
jgi:hypothetical protein